MIWFLITLCTVFLVFLCLSIIFLNNKLYAFFFLRQDRKMWEYFIKNIDKFVLVKELDLSYQFEFNDGDALYWVSHLKDNSELSGIIQGSRVVASSECTELCSTFHNLLMKRIK